MSPDSAGCVHSVFREHHLGIHLFRYAEEMHKGIEAAGAPLKQCPPGGTQAGTDRRNAYPLTAEGIPTGMETNPPNGPQARQRCL